MSRLKDNILAIAAYGMQPDSSVSRLAFSTEIRLAALAVEEMMREAGLVTHIDSVGSVHGILQGSDPACNTIAIGSHLDSVKNGGIFDGVLGVMAALECVIRIRANGRPRHSIEVLGFEAEEGSELGGTLGSRAMLGLIDTTFPGFANNAAKCGLSVQNILDARVDSKKYAAFLELHIEQGNILYRNNHKIGVVSGIVGITRYRITAIGESNHAGTTSMDDRKDALVSISRLIVQLNNLGKSFAPGFVCTVGTLSVFPGAVNVIPGRAECILELRHMDHSVIDAFVEQMKCEAASISSVEFEFTRIIDKRSTPCDPLLMREIGDICEEQGIDYVVMPSGAGHDANAMATAMPSGMIFIPSKNGYSHSASEWSEWEDCDLGADVLYRTLCALDGINQPCSERGI